MMATYVSFGALISFIIKRVKFELSIANYTKICYNIFSPKCIG